MFGVITFVSWILCTIHRGSKLTTNKTVKAPKVAPTYPQHSTSSSAILHHRWLFLLLSPYQKYSPFPNPSTPTMLVCFLLSRSSTHFPLTRMKLHISSFHGFFSPKILLNCLILLQCLLSQTSFLTHDPEAVGLYFIPAFYSASSSSSQQIAVAEQRLVETRNSIRQKEREGSQKEGKQ